MAPAGALQPTNGPKVGELTEAMKVKFSKKFSQAVVDGNLRAVEQAYNEVVAE